MEFYLAAEWTTQNGRSGLAVYEFHNRAVDIQPWETVGGPDHAYPGYFVNWFI